MGLSLCFGACGRSAESADIEAAASAYEDALIASAEQPTPAPEWIRQIGQAPSALASTGGWRIVPATLADVDYASAEPVPVRRVVYRVRFVVPPVFRQRNQQLGAQAGELQVDVGHSRLRARFVGPGWPLHEGSEVRLREDRPGVYLFDGRGGRWLPAGQLATWFEGRTDRHVSAGIRVLRDYKPVHGDGPAVLMCALLAEWTNQPRDSLVGRCRGNVVPPGFRFGPWRADLTAVLPMELPRNELRADERQPPDRPRLASSRAMLSVSELEQLNPQFPLAKAAAQLADDPGQPGGAFRVHNHTSARVVVMVQGLPVGFVDAATSGDFGSLPPGRYRVGALRPFGVLVQSPSLVDIPGELHIGDPPGAVSGPALQNDENDEEGAEGTAERASQASPGEASGDGGTGAPVATTRKPGVPAAAAAARDAGAVPGLNAPPPPTGDAGRP